MPPTTMCAQNRGMHSPVRIDCMVAHVPAVLSAPAANEMYAFPHNAPVREKPPGATAMGQGHLWDLDALGQAPPSICDGGPCFSGRMREGYHDRANACRVLTQT